MDKKTRKKLEHEWAQYHQKRDVKLSTKRRNAPSTGIMSGALGTSLVVIGTVVIGVVLGGSKGED